MTQKSERLHRPLEEGDQAIKDTINYVSKSDLAEQEGLAYFAIADAEEQKRFPDVAVDNGMALSPTKMLLVKSGESNQGVYLSYDPKTLQGHSTTFRGEKKIRVGNLEGKPHKVTIFPKDLVVESLTRRQANKQKVEAAKKARDQFHTRLETEIKT